MRSAPGYPLMVLLLAGNTASLQAQDRLFDPSFLHDTRIVLDPGDWKSLQDNFYLYQYGGQNRFTFIPWDKDTAFQEESWPLFQRVEENVITRRLLEDPALQRTYADQVLRAVDSFVNAEWLLPQLEAAYRQIREAALVDPHKTFSNEEFELAVLKLTAVIESRRADVHEQANGGR
jgi:hypothetical protein